MSTTEALSQRLAVLCEHLETSEKPRRSSLDEANVGVLEVNCGGHGKLTHYLTQCCSQRCWVTVACLREGGTGEIRQKFCYVFILIGNQIYRVNSKTTVSVFCDSGNAFSQPCVQMNVQKCVTPLRNNLQWLWLRLRRSTKPNGSWRANWPRIKSGNYFKFEE